MTRPSHVQIGPHRWRIRWVVLSESEGTPSHGLCDSDALRLSVNLDQVPSMQRSSLLHEVLHALWWQYAVNLAGDNPEESAVSALDDALLALLRDNPRLVAWLTKGAT